MQGHSPGKPFVFDEIRGEEDDGHWSRDPRDAEDHRAADEAERTFVLVPKMGRRKRGGDARTRRHFFHVDVAAFLRKLQGREAVARPGTPVHHGRVLASCLVRRNRAVSRKQAVNCMGWSLRATWEPKPGAELPPRADHLACFDEAEWDRLRQARTIDPAELPKIASDAACPYCAGALGAARMPDVGGRGRRRRGVVSETQLALPLAATGAKRTGSR